MRMGAPAVPPLIIHPLRRKPEENSLVATRPYRSEWIVAAADTVRISAIQTNLIFHLVPLVIGLGSVAKVIEASVDNPERSSWWIILQLYPKNLTIKV